MCSVRVLKSYISSHSALKKHKCSLCPYAAVERSQLQSHMKTHTGEKPFKCDKCAYAAAWNVQLKGEYSIVYGYKTDFFLFQKNLKKSRSV